MNENIYVKIVDALVSDGYIVLDNSLGQELSANLLGYAKAQTAFKQAGISSTVEKHVNTNKRRDKILWLDEDAAVQSEYLAFMSGLQAYCNRALFLGLSYYESHFAIYEEGDFYEKHLDAFKDSNHRVLTTVYYLNTMNDGGELVMYDDEKTLERIEPKADRLVVFLSDKFPHEVLKAKQKRYSIAGWFRVD
jgi:SM-20-related protein